LESKGTREGWLGKDIRAGQDPHRVVVPIIIIIIIITPWYFFQRSCILMTQKRYNG
jgi:hypothetical protein